MDENYLLQDRETYEEGEVCHKEEDKDRPVIKQCYCNRNSNAWSF